MKKLRMLGLAAVVAALAATACPAFAAAPAAPAADELKAVSLMKNAAIAPLADDTRVFKTDAAAPAYKVTFRNRYGFEVAGHLYLPAGFDRSKKYPAVVVSGPFGAVKEQVSGLYAQTLAKEGFVTLAFDQTFTGESGGEPRNMASPDIFTEDYSAAVDFVSNLKFVDAGAVGAAGICGLSGMALTAAANDVRIKAVAVSAMYDMSESISDHYKGAYYTPEQRLKVKEHLAKARQEEAVTGKGFAGSHELGFDAKGEVVSSGTMFPDKLPADADPVTKEFYGYYVERAYHPRAINSNTLAWDATAPYGFFNFELMTDIAEIAPRPILFVTGDKAHSRYFAENAFAKAAEPKELVLVPDATHTSLYDDTAKIPFAKIAAFFKENLKTGR